MKKLTEAEPATRSAELVAENVQRLVELFPEAMSEGVIDCDVLRQLLGERVAETDEKYGLNWPGKRKARKAALTPSTGTLRPAPADSVEWDSTQNVMIEGDNLEVLKLLQKSYSGRIKMIYIDPPYNTGNDFVYNDDFRNPIRHYLEVTGGHLTSNPETSGRFHTDWLNMMYPRLMLARNLLREDGVIFISIDETEVHNLRALADSIFGEECFINAITVKTKEASGASGGGEDRKLKKNVESLLLYCRSYAAFSRTEVFKREFLSDIIAEKKVQGKSYEYRQVLVDQGTREELPSLQDGSGETIKLYRHSGFITQTIDRIAKEAGLSADEAYAKYYDKVFRTTNAQTSIRTRVQKAIPGQAGLFSIEYVPRSGKNRGQLTTKYFSGPSTDLVVWLADSSSLEDGRVVKLEKSGTLWDDFAWTGIAKEGGVEFSNGKKPVAFIRRMIQLCDQDDREFIVLDFFAGSGTTGQAVMAQNAEDGTHRRFILVQLPEALDPDYRDQRAAVEFCDSLGKPRNIAELTMERLRRAAVKVGAENAMSADDRGFRVFKLDSSNIKAWEPDREDMDGSLLASLDHLKGDRTEEDILYELLLKRGLDLAVPIEYRSIAGKTVSSVGAGALVTCLAESIDRLEIEPLALGIVAWRDELQPAGETVVVLRDSAFTDDVAKTNITAILEQHGMSTVRSL